MSLPHATQQQMNEMQRVADKKMKEAGITIEEVVTEPVAQKHPMLAYQEEPTMQSRDENTELPEPDVEDESFEEEVHAAPQETHQQKNFRVMREELERAKRERDDAMRYASQFSQPKQQQYEPEDDYSDIGLEDDGLAEGKHLKKVLKEMREIKRELNNYKAKSTEDTTRIKLTTQFADYDKVMTTANLETLEAANPELAEMIMQTPDMYKRAKLAYNMVKQYGIHKETPSYDIEKAVAQKNAAKPRPLASVSPQQSDSPLSKANAFANGALSEEMKMQYRKEMALYSKGR